MGVMGVMDRMAGGYLNGYLLMRLGEAGSSIIEIPSFRCTKRACGMSAPTPQTSSALDQSDSTDSTDTYTERSISTRIPTQEELNRFAGKCEGGMDALETSQQCIFWLPSAPCGSPPEGYKPGRFHFRGRTCLAHRLSYEWFVGPIPGDKPIVRHTCPYNSRGACVNPRHLVVGTASDNAKDRQAARRKEAQTAAILKDLTTASTRLEAGARSGMRYPSASDADLQLLESAVRRLRLAAEETVSHEGTPHDTVDTVDTVAHAAPSPPPHDSLHASPP